MSQPNIVSKYAKRTVFKNRGRTILTLFGIIIATAMFCVVVSARSSCVDILKSFQDDDYGTWHVQAYSMTSREYQQILKDTRIKRSAYVQEYGYVMAANTSMDEAELKNKLSYQNYDVMVASMSPGFTDLCQINLVKGRMPQNENEAIISLEMYADNRDMIDEEDATSYEFTMVYSRYSNGHKVNNLKEISRDEFGYGEEYLSPLDKKEFRVVGCFVVPDYAKWKNLSFYTVLLGPSEMTAGNAVNAYFELEDPASYVAFSDEYFESTDDCLFNKDYIRMKNSADDSDTIRWIDILTFSAVTIIALLAVMLIYNSFSTSSTDRIRAIGLLKSVGATRRQIRDLMLGEAFYYVIIAVPIGLVIGNISAYILFGALNDLAKEAGFYLLSQEVDLQYRLGLSNTLMPVALSIITIAVAIFVPMYRASQITPIEAVRVNNVFTTKVKRKKSRGLAVRFLGFNSALAIKNFFRYRKRYRATILSVFLSIMMILFTHALVRTIISMFSSSEGVDSNLLTYSYYFGNNSFDASDLSLYYQLADLSNVKDSLIILQSKKEIEVEAEDLTERYRNDYADPNIVYDSQNGEYPVYEDSGRRVTNVTLMFIEDSAFRKICIENGIAPDPYFTYGSKLCLTNNTFYSNTDENLNTVKVFSSIDNPKDVVLRFSEEESETTPKVDIQLTKAISEPFSITGDTASTMQIYMPLSRMSYYGVSYKDVFEFFQFHVSEPDETFTQMKKILEKNLHSSEDLHDSGAYARAYEAVTTMAKILIYGYAALLCLICFLNVIMTIISNVLFRRKEYILLMSIGMSKRTLFHTVILESIICFFESLLLLALFAGSLLILVTMLFDLSVISKRNILFLAVTVFAHFLMITSTTAFGLRHVLTENVIEGVRKEYY